MKGIVSALIVALVAVAANECPQDWQNEEKLLVHTDCNKYYMCTYGEPVEMGCWGDLFFNVETGECDWQENVDCGDRYIPGQEPTTAEPVTNETTTAVPTTTEAATDVPTTTEAVTDAPTTTEAATDAPTTTEAATDAPTTTEAATVAPTTTEAATDAPTTTEAATDAPTTTEVATDATTANPDFLENGCPVDPHVHWLLPVEGDCNGFYYCVWGELVLRACPATLHFNPVIQVCDWPENAGCVASRSVNKHNLAQYYQ